MYFVATMNMPQAPSTAPARRRLALPSAPVLVMNGGGWIALTTDGEMTSLTRAKAAELVRKTMPIVCNAPYIAGILGIERFQAYDVLELFAFVHPGRFCVPSPRGLAASLGLMEPATPDDECLSLRDAARHILADLQSFAPNEKSNPAGIAAMMGLMQTANPHSESGWPWAPAVLAALGRAETPPAQGEIKASLRIWDRLPEWAVHAPEPPAEHHGISEDDIAERLHKLLVRQKKEDRPQQAAYAKNLGRAFAPRNGDDQTHAVMAEAGTGTGKTLGYLAPASVWAEKNGGAVWVSTYTKNLQRQVDGELDKLYEDAATKARKVVTRKGRENYLCLLNLEDAAQSPATMASDLNAIALGLLLRWAAVTQDGDFGGTDFPGWLTGILGWNRVYNFADRRGECIYSACPHFNKCFVEKSVRKSKRADIVIANHALVMHQTGVAAPGEMLPTRYVFDEGHHLFDAADGAFGLQINGTETAELRRWILGVETAAAGNGGKSRMRGLKRRIEDLIENDDGAKKDLDAAIDAARALPAPQWRQRLSEQQPKGAGEIFLHHVLRQVYARNKDVQGFYSLETGALPALPELCDAARDFAAKLDALLKPLQSLHKRLQKKLADEADTLEPDAKERLRFVGQSLYRRSSPLIGGWIEMLRTISAAQDTAGASASTPAPANGLVDWLEVSRADGKDHDVGFYRCYVDPARVFAQSLKPHAHGVVITSASLRDPSENDADGWTSPTTRTGFGTLSAGGGDALLFHSASPFDYKDRTRVLVLRDVDKNATDEVAAAFRALFTAAGGGALGIFTAVQRLRAVHEKLKPALNAAHLRLYAQHADPLDTATLIDIFREEENACLLGTDATRDGIDVPGRSLRLVVYDRVPWPRPTLLHKARRAHFGKNAYDDMLTRFKLKQAYGRLIRKADDKGVFVMLDSALPTRLTSAFPEGVDIQRVSLKEAIDIINNFLH